MGFLEDLGDAVRMWLLSESPTEVAMVGGAAMIIYVVAMWITRTGKHRFLGGNTVFDVLLGFILGSTLSRAINGSAEILSSAVAGFVLIGMHYLMSLIAHRSDRFGHIVKGGFEKIVEDGRADREAMRRHLLTDHDLQQAMRSAGVQDVQDVSVAYFERGGKISVVPRLRIQVLDVDVADGVQNVKIHVHV